MQNVGGQAVIEGVMMKSPGGWSVAVRDQKGEIHVKRQLVEPRKGLLKMPFVRGVMALIDAIVIGVKAIDFSASRAYSEDEKPISPLSIALTIILAFGLAVAIFIFLPLYLTKLIPFTASHSLWFNTIDGFIRVGLFILYVFAIGLWKDMARIFEYHGAEHKVIHAYEEGLELGIDNIRPYSPHHPRCGTSFLFIVMVLSIFVFSLIPHSWDFMLKFLSRIVLIPLIAGISYEALRYSAKKKDNAFINLMIQPGLLLQRLTTREPDESQIEVAVVALREAVSLAGDR
ncbi:hypothetical protein BMS3Abin07_02351 [bacterium BMS3Abin07]|nr:hypothetical protein BMS3Abin07_02351 [bacterium BMS3Abin07]GBE31376.1 hypothetical protein BMS3Bbin05_00276 [bacterium BMS3Bbin05]HDL20641.1 DUF1385 domain-containing protein [Nitrospirota bacterium]HDO22349.1 DUF1385 domain-containing protein [Nitrospirota bacterium]HDZ88466.1 DUF1385 domain-containing protein [Nitrospirota bacterium]